LQGLIAFLVQQLLSEDYKALLRLCSGNAVLEFQYDFADAEALDACHARLVGTEHTVAEALAQLRT